MNVPLFHTMIKDDALMGKIDLHIHTSYSSDGDFTPRQILSLCKDLGMNAVAITDHNCVKGVEEALRYGKQLQIDVMPGIEIDCTHRSVNLHVLGYYIDIQHKGFEELEQNMKDQGMNAFNHMITNLKKCGIEVNEEEVLKAAQGKVVCGELIGEVILNKTGSEKNALLKPYLKEGSRSDNPYLNFYLDFFAKGKPAYVPMKYMELSEVVALIKKSRGIPVLAHPGNNLRNHLNLLDGILKEGVLGIEVFSNYHAPEQIGYFLDAARKHKAIITCGSDFHGKNKPGIQIGSCNCTIDEQSILNSLKDTEQVIYACGASWKTYVGGNRLSSRQ